MQNRHFSKEEEGGKTINDIGAVVKRKKKIFCKGAQQKLHFLKKQTLTFYCLLHLAAEACKVVSLLRVSLSFVPGKKSRVGVLLMSKNKNVILN